MNWSVQIVSVSYTHLDVYKRQKLTNRNNFFRVIESAENYDVKTAYKNIETCGKQNLNECSENKTDVYKRQAMGLSQGGINPSLYIYCWEQYSRVAEIF